MLKTVDVSTSVFVFSTRQMHKSTTDKAFMMHSIASFSSQSVFRLHCSNYQPDNCQEDNSLQYNYRN